MFHDLGADMGYRQNVLAQMRTARPGDAIAFDMRDLSRAFPSFEHKGETFTPADRVLENIIGSAYEWKYHVDMLTSVVHFIRLEKPSETPVYQSPDRRQTVSSKKEMGLYGKFNVTRTDGRDCAGEKHHGCSYFCLDLNHDKYAVPALRAYAEACADEYPVLSSDLLILIHQIETDMQAGEHGSNESG